MKKTFFKMASVVMLGASLVIGFPSCENPEVMNTLKELQDSDSISKADLAKLQSLLSQAQKKVAETEQELQNVKQNQGGSSKVDLSEIEGEISGINSQLAGWKKLLQEKIDSLGKEMPSVEGFAKTEDLENLPTKDDLEKMQEKITQMQWQINANGYEFVDLGLSVLWATCNVGAENPENAGDYFAWGEVESKTEYTAENYTAGDWKQDLDADHDAATHNWGGKWRMPSRDEFEELIEKCQLTWNEDKNGYDVKKQKNENSIFLPFTGSSNDVVCFWSRSFLYEYSSFLLYIEKKGELKIDTDLVEYGFTVRPVLPKN